MGRQNSTYYPQYIRIGKSVIKFTNLDKIFFISKISQLFNLRISYIKSKFDSLPRTTKKEWIRHGFIRIKELTESQLGELMVNFIFQIETFIENAANNPIEHVIRAPRYRVKIRRAKRRERIRKHVPGRPKRTT